MSGSGVVTFLFTDIEGSTRRWESDPDAMRSALESHDAVLRECVEKYDGRLFKHTGDGICAAFASPRSAVDAAVAAQQVLELPVRMGIATGEAALRDGDYFGAVLNRASRVMAAGHGGQILVDGATAGLLSDTALSSLGPKRLRDIAEPVEIFQVRAPNLRIDFPPLQTLDSTPGNLRPPATRIIGRDIALDEVHAALKAHRLVTLTGVGGVGKTRLSLEAAARSANDFPDGVWVVELASVGDPAAVPDVVAAVLGVTPQPGLTVAQSVAAALEGRCRLLIFDNCEHVLDASAEMVEMIFALSPTVKVLATSREGLRLADEQLWPVPSLDVRTGAESAAVDLFMERACAVAPGISLSSAEVDVVVDICRRLDGIPLAIELAASRLQSMTVTDVRDRLDDRFRLLVGSRRGLERHQTLRHAVQWSFDLLDDNEKHMLTRCSVFAGGFDLAGACAVTGSDDEFLALDLLDALTRKSLLIADRSTAHARFSMLETIRQFAEEQLVASGTGEATRGVHAKYFANRESDVLALWDSSRQREAYTWFALELPNLRTAFRWAADHGDLDAAAPIAVYSALLGFWVEQMEPVAWAEELIGPAEAVKHRRLAQLYAMAARCAMGGRIDDGFAYATAGLQTMDEGRFDAIPFEIDAELAGHFGMEGNLDRWIKYLRDKLSLAPDTHVYTRGYLVSALSIAEGLDEALAESESLARVEEFTDNPALICWAYNMYGWVRHSTDPGSATEAHRRGLTIAQDSGNRLLETYLASNLCRLAAAHGDSTEAFDLLAVAINNYAKSGNYSLLPQPMAVLVAYLDRLGYFDAAATISGFSTSPFVGDYYPELHTAIAHLREVLGDETFESIAAKGNTMSNAAMAAYALDQISHARAQLALRDEPT
ncbi:ATP-binding protein [Mycobacterium sp. NPDC051804]|uniref:ATP-binding protein n=1 Tax=Mycobacterium sp. NPDC051804 TaxID=3364295 RepID=UPI0037BCDE35